MPLLQTGSILSGRYRIDGVIGQGGMGAVYKAEDVFNGRAVAVKELFDEFADPAAREEARQLFANEADILSQLSHPSLVAIYDRFSDLGNQYLVMDFVEGETLQRLWERTGQFPEETVLGWAIALTDALEYLHNRLPPVIFRDMKPSNVMLLPSGSLMLIDFGIARTLKPLRGSDTVNIGSPGYAAPEQYGGMGQSDARTDLYSLGVVMHQLLTGVDPAQNPFALPPVAQYCADVSPGTIAVVERATKLPPEERFASAAEMKQRLVEARAAMPPAPRPAALRPARLPSMAPAPAIAAAPSAAAPLSAPPGPAIGQRILCGVIGFCGAYFAVMLPFYAGAAHEAPLQQGQILSIGYAVALPLGVIMGLVGMNTTR